jgi:hypothetical protein
MRAGGFRPVMLSGMLFSTLFILAIEFEEMTP